MALINSKDIKRPGETVSQRVWGAQKPIKNPKTLQQREFNRQLNLDLQRKACRDDQKAGISRLDKLNQPSKEGFFSW
jgi:hypothetical protein